MEVITVHESGIVESCPVASLEGFFLPNDNQLTTILTREGHLNPSLNSDSIVTWGDAPGTLAAAAVFRLIFVDRATVPFGFGGAANPDLATAIADLAVTGESNYANFVSSTSLPDEASTLVSIPLLKAQVTTRVEAEAARLGATLTVAADGDEVAEAVDFVVDRALRVAWALNGPSTYRASARAALGWIATNAMRDQPRRPVNIPASSWPTADTMVTVAVAGGNITCRTRYAIGGATEVARADDVSNSLPDAARPPIIDSDADVFIFLHGHSSRLEEAGGIYEELRNEAGRSFYSRPIVLVSFDFPSNGYSQYFDHDAVMPLATTTRYVPDHPEERRFGILEFYERFVVAFVEALDRDLVNSGQRGILDRIVAVIGGSMGGNLALRLSERLVTMAWWMRNAVSWSPASAYESFGNKDYVIPSPGEEVDPIGKEALERTHQRCMEAENDGSRATFFALQLNGERIINDGTPEFETMTRLLGLLLQPFVGGLAPFIPFVGPLVGPLLSGLTGPVVFGSSVIEGVANLTAVKQSDEWLRADCRAGFNPAVASQGFLLELQERYSAIRRRTHWRVAYEQLLFSHQDVVAASRGRPCYALAVVPTLLIAGANDTVDRTTGFDIYGGVRRFGPLMRGNSGRVVFIDNTGHSIHAERPKWLAREIFGYLMSRALREVVAVSRARSGGISRLYFRPIVRSVDETTAIRRTLGSQGYYYFETIEGRHQPIYARRFLSTTPDDVEENNLRALPPTRLPLLPWREMRSVSGPAGGFQVTHIRLRTSGPEPWNTWVSHLCNDSLEFQIATQEAENAILAGTKRFFLVHDGEEVELRVVEYLHTAPNETAADNLSSLPVITE